MRTGWNDVFRGDRPTDLVVGFELMTFRNSRTCLAGCNPRGTGSYVAFRPMGLTLIIPLRNSTKVPLVTVNKCPNPNDLAGVSPFNRDIQVRDVMQDEVHERLIPIFTNGLNKRLGWKLFSQFVGGQPVLSKSVIEFIDNCKEGGS